VKPAPFEYRKARNVEDAIALLASTGRDGRLLAGGQTLGPMLNMRLARPKVLVDIGHLAELRTIDHGSGEIVIGACVTQSALEDQTDASPTGRLIAHVAGSIAYRAVRNRGTIGGSLAHADPAADWPVLCTLLRARLQIEGPNRTRVVEAEQFMRGAFTTAIQSGEILRSILLGRLPDGARWGYCKIRRKVGEFPDAIGAVALDPNGKRSRAVVGAIEGSPAVLAESDSLLGRMRASTDLPGVEEALRPCMPHADATDIHLHAVALMRAARQAMQQ
jgi:carbon-monoxide dehydrogenase medium subunit